MVDGHAAPTAGERLGCLCSGPSQDLHKVDEKRIGRNLDRLQLAERRPSLFIDLLANYGDSALIDAGGIPTLNR
jgi:hypothetical protein